MGLKNKHIFFKKTKSNKGTENSFASFIDSNGLRWKLVTQENIPKFPKEFEELHSWSNNANIQRFIAQRRTLDVVFKIIAPSADSNSRLFFCYDNATFVGLIYTSTPYNEKDDGTIQYIIVNPDLQKKGYGSMMTNSVLHNTDKFFTHKFSHNINASVEEENISSRQTFENNNFVDIGKNTSSERRYRIYRYQPKSIEMGK